MGEYFPLIIFTLLINLCAGTFIVYALWQYSRLTDQESREQTERLLMPTLLVGLGIAMLMSATHLGKPFKFIQAFRNPGSMIAQEGIWSTIFLIILLVAVVFTLKNKRIPRLLYLTGSFVSVILLLVSSLAYVKAYGIPAWNHGVTVVYFFASAALLGTSAVYTLEHAKRQPKKSMAAILLVAIFCQLITALAFKFQLQFNVMDVQLPSTLGLDIMRWVIGLFIPAAIAYTAWKEKWNSKYTAWSFILCIAVGEILSRVTFFIQGVHL